jgi:hypothetical protein
MSLNLLQECKHCWQHYLEGLHRVCREGPILRAQVFSVLLTAHLLTLATLVPRHRLRERRAVSVWRRAAWSAAVMPAT